MNVRFKSCFLKSCYRDLNSGPLPYQGSALPLSYNSRLRAENGAQTRDPQLGRLVLYRLSYFRETRNDVSSPREVLCLRRTAKPPKRLVQDSRNAILRTYNIEWVRMDSNHRS